MILLAADENFNNDILGGLLRRDPSLNIVRIQDVGLTHAPDSVVFEWAAQDDRVLLTHDRNTVTKLAYDPVKEGKSMPGVIEVKRAVPMSVAIEDILLLAVSSTRGEWKRQIIYLPLR